jgi:hypothetical protein
MENFARKGTRWTITNGAPQERNPARDANETPESEPPFHGVELEGSRPAVKTARAAKRSMLFEELDAGQYLFVVQGTTV